MMHSRSVVPEHDMISSRDCKDSARIADYDLPTRRGEQTVRRKYYVVVALVVSGAFTLAACGSDNDDSMDGLSGMNSSSSTSRSASGDAAGDFNDADVTFASTMIPRHQQAVEMAELAETLAKSPEVKSLATLIKGAQDPEIRTMSGWLTAWGERVPSDTSSDMGEMDMSEGSSMPGLKSPRRRSTRRGTSNWPAALITWGP